MIRTLNSRLATLTVGGSAASAMTQSLVTQSFDIRGYTGCSFQAVYTGSPQGTFTIEAFNDNPADIVTVEGSWTTINASGSYIWNLRDAYYAFVRLRYIFTSGSGTLTVFASAKGS